LTENTGAQPHNEPVSHQRRVLTYGTYDLLHYGHIRLLERARALGDFLAVGLSTDEFNAQKGKSALYPYAVRREMLEAVRYVDLVFPESTWEQKRRDIITHRIDVVVMGSDWKGSPRFEDLRDICEVVFLEYTGGISTTEVRELLAKEPAFRAQAGQANRTP
jgi:glycerol-3-phosphate cytidylyltransferase